MLICPNGHTAETGKYCAECRGEMREATADAGIRLRSPDAHATATVNPTFVLPGGSTAQTPVIVKCPKCGHRNAEPDVFDCQGPCGKVNLCRRHFDEEYEVCRDCAALARGDAEKLAAEWAALRAAAEKAGALARVTRERDAAREGAQQAEQQAVARDAQARSTLGELRARLAEQEAALGEWRVRAEAAEQALAAARLDVNAKAHALQQAEAQLAERDGAVAKLDAEAKTWRGRAEAAAGEMAEIQRKADEATANEAQRKAQAAAAQAKQYRRQRPVEEAHPEPAPAGVSEIALSPVELDILAELRRASHRVTLTTVAETLRLEAQAVAERLEDLIQKGYVQQDLRDQMAGIPAGHEQATYFTRSSRRAEIDELLARRRALARAAAAPAPQQIAIPNWQRVGIELAPIPGGDFLFGNKRRRVTLGEYYLAKTPVTNAQYKVFVDAARHGSPAHWPGGHIPAGKEQHPVVYVTWEDARAFCEWAGLRLPSEQEWEKGARGADGRLYPWGAWSDGRCNNVDAKLGGTSVVGVFQPGASPYELLDMAGNVWEWCADWFDGEEKHRVLRGGSWQNHRLSVQCINRLNGHPGQCNDAIGFRCAA